MFLKNKKIDTVESIETEKQRVQELIEIEKKKNELLALKRELDKERQKNNPNLLKELKEMFRK